MTRTEFVADLVELAKPRLLAYLEQLPPQSRQRLDGLEDEIQGIGTQFRQGVWAVVLAHLAERAEQEAGHCGRCGRRCCRDLSWVPLVVLGQTVLAQVVYYYCRRCKSGRGPMRQWLGVHAGSASSRFMRALVALCLMRSFGKGAEQFKEQHGQEVDRTRAERVTYQVGKEAQQYLEQRREREQERVNQQVAMIKGAPLLELFADGGGAPVGKLVRPPLEQATELTKKRKLPKGQRPRTKREVRLICVHPPEQVTGKIVDLHIAPHDHPEVSGQRMYAAALEAGLGDNTRVHGVFDMGLWIASQFAEQFPGAQNTAAADFYHTVEYLGGAAQVLFPRDEPQRKQWLSLMSHWLKLSETDLVAQQLAAHECGPRCPVDDHGTCRVQAALRYVLNHEGYMDYARFVAEGLPIGSGEAEGGVRHWIRARLDVPGTWDEENLKCLCALQTVWACGWWDDFWRWRDERDVDRFHRRQQGLLKATSFRGTPRTVPPVQQTLPT